MEENKILMGEIKDYILKNSLSEEKDINEDTRIFESGLLDSMGLLFLIEFLNEKYQVEVNDEELNPKNFESINSIAAFIESKL